VTQATVINYAYTVDYVAELQLPLEYDFTLNFFEDRMMNIGVHVVVGLIPSFFVNYVIGIFWFIVFRPSKARARKWPTAYKLINVLLFCYIIAGLAFLTSNSDGLIWEDQRMQNWVYATCAAHLFDVLVLDTLVMLLCKLCHCFSYWFRLRCFYMEYDIILFSEAKLKELEQAKKVKSPQKVNKNKDKLLSSSDDGEGQPLANTAKSDQIGIVTVKVHKPENESVSEEVDDEKESEEEEESSAGKGGSSENVMVSHSNADRNPNVEKSIKDKSSQLPSKMLLEVPGKSKPTPRKQTEEDDDDDDDEDESYTDSEDYEEDDDEEDNDDGSEAERKIRNVNVFLDLKNGTQKMANVIVTHISIVSYIPVEMLRV
jgi:hypothetical protein